MKKFCEHGNGEPPFTYICGECWLKSQANVAKLSIDNNNNKVKNEINIKHCFIPFKWGLRFHLFHHGFYFCFCKREYMPFSRFYKLRHYCFYFCGLYIEFF
jgi:hypothetical protein